MYSITDFALLLSTNYSMFIYSMSYVLLSYPNYPANLINKCIPSFKLTSISSTRSQLTSYKCGSTSPKNFRTPLVIKLIVRVTSIFL